MGRGKKVLFATVVLVAFLLALEAVVRASYAVRIGPRLLFYGSALYRKAEKAAGIEAQQNHTVMYHHNVVGDYAKYYPGESRTDNDPLTGETFQVRINNHGFRGRDFVMEKAPGTVRIVTLGESSTFGYSNRDGDTYPAQLEMLLNRGAPRAVEVINLGIPHLWSGQILSLFRREALPLAPDIVTLYAGANDCTGAAPIERPVASLAERAWGTASNKLLLAKLLDEQLGTHIKRYDREELDILLRGRVDRFLSNVTQIRDDCAERGIRFIAMRQQARSFTLPREEYRGVTYQEEIRMLEGRLEEQGYVDRFQAQLLMHDVLSTALEEWSLESGTPFVDVAEILDLRRDLLVSWIHLAPEANRRIAEALADKILEEIGSRGVESGGAAGEAGASAKVVR